MHIETEMFPNEPAYTQSEMDNDNGLFEFLPFAVGPFIDEISTPTLH